MSKNCSRCLTKCPARQPEYIKIVHCPNAKWEGDKMTKEPKRCEYCNGEGSYTTHTWGIEKVEECRFCNGTGKEREKDG